MKGTPVHRQSRFHWPRIAALTTLALFLAGCYPPSYRVVQRPSLAPPADTRVYYYPTHGQNHTQQERDRYECHLWAVQQTGFDPSKTPLAPHQRVEVMPENPPGSNTAAGAVTGAIVGSAIAGPRQTGEGLVFGAITGAMMGAAADNAQQQQAQAIQQQYNSQYARQYANAERMAANYRRALSACLAGRGYNVQ